MNPLDAAQAAPQLICAALAIVAVGIGLVKLAERTGGRR